MIKVIYCIRRREDLSPSEFQQYWKGVHGQLLMEHRQALRLAGYVQTSPLAHKYSPTVERPHALAAPFDGVAELYWASEDDMNYAFEDARALEVQKLLADDEKNFIDHKHSSRWIAHEVAPIERQTISLQN